MSSIYYIKILFIYFQSHKLFKTILLILMEWLYSIHVFANNPKDVSVSTDRF